MGLGFNFDPVRSKVANDGMVAFVVVLAIDGVKNFESGISGVSEASSLEHLTVEGADKRSAPDVAVGSGPLDML